MPQKPRGEVKRCYLLDGEMYKRLQEQAQQRPQIHPSQEFNSPSPETGMEPARKVRATENVNDVTRPDDNRLLVKIPPRYRAVGKAILAQLQQLPGFTFNNSNIIELENSPLHGLDVADLLHQASTPLVRSSFPTAVWEFLICKNIKPRNHVVIPPPPVDIPNWRPLYTW